MHEIARIGLEIEADAAVKVAVFQSADSEFFIAHADVNMIQQLPVEALPKPTTPSPFHQMVDRFRTMPKVTIAKIEGRCRGGGSELALSLDMRFAARGKTLLSQPEVAIGIIPGGGGTQRLPRLIGRGRALEVILGCLDVDADLAERYGYVNRAFEPDELGPFVDQLAYRIASFPAEAIALAKAAVNAAELPTIDGLIEEAHYFNQAVATPVARELMAHFLAVGGQTRDMERHFGDLVGRIA
jgi:enoyl-CoA hydratase/carnithine racemase